MRAMVRAFRYIGKTKMLRMVRFVVEDCDNYYG